jgi:hypothetical protein
MLRSIQAQLQAVYRIAAPDIRQFLIDGDDVTEVLGEDARTADEWVVIREGPQGVDVGVYISPEYLQRLAAHPHPAAAIPGAFTAYCAATEGVSHFLMLFDRVRREEPVSMLELEAQAEIDKFVSAVLHHPDRQQEWWDRLFRNARLADGLSEEEAARYTEAARLAGAFCATLTQTPHTAALLALLRQFWRDSGAKRLDRMRRLAA